MHPNASCFLLIAYPNLLHSHFLLCECVGLVRQTFGFDITVTFLFCVDEYAQAVQSYFSLLTLQSPTFHPPTPSSLPQTVILLLSLSPSLCPLSHYLVLSRSDQSPASVWPWITLHGVICHVAGASRFAIYLSLVSSPLFRRPLSLSAKTEPLPLSELISQANSPPLTS